MKSRWAVCCFVFLIVSGCDGGSDDDDGAVLPTSGLVLLSPLVGDTPLVVGWDSITLEVQADGLETVSASNADVTLSGTRSGTSFFVFGIPLNEGLNEIRLIGSPSNGPDLEAVIGVQAENSITPFALVVEPDASEIVPLQVHLNVKSGVGMQATPLEVLYDYEGDGVIDAESVFPEPADTTFAKIGRYRPTATIRTEDNLLYTAPAIISVLPEARPDPAQAIENVGRDVADLSYVPMAREFYVLSSSESVVRRINAEGQLLEEISLPGTVRPQGLALDSDRNLYVADTGNHRMSCPSLFDSVIPGLYWGNPGA